MKALGSNVVGNVVLLALLAPLHAAPPAAATGDASAIRFVDVARERGLDFHHEIGRDDVFYAVETTGSGACVLDIDGDGDDDVFLVQGGAVRDPEDDGAPRPPWRAEPSRLFRNEGGTFVDVTEASGLGGPVALWGMGCSVADVDGDGDADILETGLGRDRLLLGDGSGRFRDVATAAGLADPRWTTSAAFADFDGDRDLDLYVGAYVEFVADGKRCRAPGTDVTCGPRDYRGVRGRLLRNDGPGEDGVPRFADVTRQAGAVEPAGKTLGVLFEDLNGDGWPDLYLANDTERNTLLLNQGDGTFRDATVLAGVGLSDVGVKEAGMGVDAGDLDGAGDLLPELVVTNFHLETNTIYQARGPGVYRDVSDASGAGAASLRHLAFGANLGDFDLDGDLDLFVANGHVEPNVRVFDRSTSHAQRDQVFENLSDSGRIVLRDAGPDALDAPAVVSRGSALLDFDADGDLDVLVSANAGDAQLLENRSARQRRHWLAVRLVAPPPNREAVGALVRVRVSDRSTPLVRRVRTGSSFLSASTTRAHFGLGTASTADVEVRWPDGLHSRHEALSADRCHVLTHPALAEAASGGEARSVGADAPAPAGSRSEDPAGSRSEDPAGSRSEDPAGSRLGAPARRDEDAE